MARNVDERILKLELDARKKELIEKAQDDEWLDSFCEWLAPRLSPEDWREIADFYEARAQGIRADECE